MVSAFYSLPPSGQQRVGPIPFFLPDFAFDLRYIPEMQTRAADSIYLPGNNETRIPDRDSLLALCAQVGYEAIEDQMQRYYEEAIDAVPEDDDRREAVRRMREIVGRIGGSILKRELEYGEAIALPDNTPEKRNKKVAAFYALADKSVARGDASMEMRALIYIFRKLCIQEQYHAAFLCAERIAGRLEKDIRRRLPGKEKYPVRPGTCLLRLPRLRTSRPPPESSPQQRIRSALL
ncbi:hypothetical protein [Parabacteroides faecis]|uniref:hypothetical protein n=1 Tax=Parabacteroides faecis TaxID=1217282 RepID=UPI0021664CF6|nr:hypothetical protein [Parabacteroides faecis]MCS2893908.1 hypothetical protein [Parabacteroides faecis]